MRYSFQVMPNGGGMYISEESFVKLGARLANGWVLPPNSFLQVTDNLHANKLTFKLDSMDAIHNWISDMEISGSMMMEADNCAAPKKAWRPFKEEELSKKEISVEDLHIETIALNNEGVINTDTLKLPDSNLKTASAVGKPNVSAVPPLAFFALGAAMQDGANKYGKFNWRGTGVTASVFYDAMMRHLTEWYSSENFAQDSGIHHLAHLMAGCAIVLDAEHCKVFSDDRDVVKPMGLTAEDCGIFKIAK